jgi:hypothetical protein
MVKPLDDTTLAGLSSWDGAKLFWRFELISDRRKLMQVQDAFGVANKSTDDPDVAQMEVEYNALRAEILDRVGNKHKKTLDDFELYSNSVVLNTAGRAGALGIPAPTETDIELVALKGDLNTAADTLLGLLV